MADKNINKKTKLFNNTFCYFNEEGDTLKEVLASSFLDYLSFKETEKTTCKDESRELTQIKQVVHKV